MPIDDSAISQYDMLKDLPWLSISYLDNSLYAYILTVVTFVVIWLLLHVARRYIMRRLERQAKGVHGSTYGTIREFLGHLSPGIFPLIAFYLATKRLTLADNFENAVKVVTIIATVVQITRLVSELAVLLVTRTRTHGGRLDDAVMRSTNQNLSVLTRVGIWAAGILFLLDNLGFNVSTFIAGLGIGGVAIALATQAILGDTFSSFAIALDKPFEVGDFIVIDDLMGNVEHIGLKTTRVRSAGGELLIFANSDLTKSRIKNFKKMVQRRASFKLGVSPTTSEAKLLKVVEILKEAVTAQPDTRLDRAHFAAFGDSSLIYEVVYFVLKAEYNVFMDTQQAINLRIVEAFAAEGLEIAFSTPTAPVRKK